MYFLKNNVKRQERYFTEADRAFKSEGWVPKIEVTWIDQWNLKFSIENEVEINQVLYFYTNIAHFTIKKIINKMMIIIKILKTQK